MDKFFWHLTEKEGFALDPAYHPLSAYGIPRPTAKPGLFVTDNPVYWSPWMGEGPIFAARVIVPEDALPPPSFQHPEYFLTDFDRMKVTEFLSLERAIELCQDERQRKINWWDQHYGGFGSVMDWWFYSPGYDKEPKPRKGLEKLMRQWKKENPGFEDPDQYFRAKYR